MNESKNLRNKIIITNVIHYIKIITDTNTNGKKNPNQILDFWPCFLPKKKPNMLVN